MAHAEDYLETEKHESMQCVFCQIASGNVRPDIVFDGGDTLFFHDIKPKARFHIIGIPKKHIGSIADINGDNHAIIGKLFHEAADVARGLGIEKSGYRVITNSGGDAGQQVPHLHLHILGGESLGPLRC